MNEVVLSTDSSLIAHYGDPRSPAGRRPDREGILEASDSFLKQRYAPIIKRSLRCEEADGESIDEIRESLLHGGLELAENMEMAAANMLSMGI